MAFRFEDKEKNKTHTLSLVVKTIEQLDLMKAAAASNGEGAPADSSAKPKHIDAGQLMANSVIVFDKEEGSMLSLIGKSKGYRKQRKRQKLIQFSFPESPPTDRLSIRTGTSLKWVSEVSTKSSPTSSVVRSLLVSSHQNSSNNWE